MESRENKLREYNTDVLNSKNGGSYGGSTLYDPHPFLKDRQHCDTRARTSFQDSNIFGYKNDNNVTWQNTGREGKGVGIKSGVYDHARISADNVVFDPRAPMAGMVSNTAQHYVVPTPDMYRQDDPQVPKSRLGEEIYGHKDFNRQAVRSDLQSQNTYWLRHNDATSNVDNQEGLTPSDKRQRDLVSSQSNQIQAPYQQLPPRDFRHESNSSWQDDNKSDKRSNIHQDVNTFVKRAQELSSVNNPLTTTDYSEYTPKTRQQETFEDVDKRVKDAFYSDLYGQTGKHGLNTAVAQRSEVSSSTGIFSKEGQSKGSRWGEDISAAQRRQDFLKTTGFTSSVAGVQPHYTDDKEINMARASIRMPKVIKGCELQSRSLHSDEFNQRYNVIKDHRETNVISLLFNNLPAEMDAESLKAMSGAKHVVRVAVKTDNIKNQCTGQGEITIRLFEQETKAEIVKRFRAAGLNVEDKPEDAVQKQSNYQSLSSTGWRDSKYALEEKRSPGVAWESDKLSKLANLSTNIHMGDSDYLVNMNKQYADVVRNHDNGHNDANKNASAHNQLMVDWTNMRPQTAGPSSGARLGDSPFMRPTESFNTRSKMVQDGLGNRRY